MSVYCKMTIREIMVLKILILFLLFGFSEQRLGYERFEEKGNVRRDDFTSSWSFPSRNPVLNNNEYGNIRREDSTTSSLDSLFGNPIRNNYDNENIKRDDSTSSYRGSPSGNTNQNNYENGNVRTEHSTTSFWSSPSKNPIRKDEENGNIGRNDSMTSYWGSPPGNSIQNNYENGSIRIEDSTTSSWGSLFRNPTRKEEEKGNVRKDDFATSSWNFPSRNPIHNNEENGSIRIEDSTTSSWDFPHRNFTEKSVNHTDKVHFPNESFENKETDNHNNINNNNENSSRDALPKNKCGLDVPRRIIGGSTTDIDEFPWLCLLQYVDPSGKTSHDCSGVLISKRYVLTAAHCTHGLGITTRKLKLRKIRLGEWDTSTEKDCQGDVCSSRIQEIDVEEVIPHEKYKPRQKSQMNDIALIRLRQEANLNQFVQPICLPFDNIGNSDYEGKKLTVSGWGRTTNARNSASTIKMKVDLPVTSWKTCSEFYDSFYGGLKISKSQFCAGGEDGKDSCQGDSGGPLMTTERAGNEVKWFVIGIVSSGPAACAVEGRPSLYTNVSQFMDWISNNIKS